MENQRNNADQAGNNDSDGLLEKIARTIDPPSREVSDAELIDPGANSPAGKPQRTTNPPTSPDPTPADSTDKKQDAR